MDGLAAIQQWRTMERTVMEIVSGLENNKWRTYDYWMIDGDDVWVHWEESWSYGGHDEGTIHFPTSRLIEELAKV